MYFTFSRLLSWFVEPSTWLFLLQVAALVLLWKARYRAARWILVVSVLATFAVNELPVPSWLIRPLEQAVPAPARLPDRIDGIVLLGGSFDTTLTEVYGAPQLNAEAERVTEFLALAREHPQAKLVFTGGTSLLSGRGITEAEVLKRFLARLGVDGSRVIYDDKARNTYENALYTRDLVKPKPGENWLLVTSASHMPRAHGTFRKVGWDIIPYPVAYRARPTFAPGARDYETLAYAVHEWIGIAVYRVTGRM
jgi:uncharacterized SAM-binding protein YcdF (DUF218 family)